MKTNYFFQIALIFALSILTASCSKDKKLTPSGCINEKIEAFKLESNAQAVYEYDAPDGKLYLFQHSCVDCGDYFYNEDCEVICVGNLEGFDPDVTPCELAVLNSSYTKIWEK